MTQNSCLERDLLIRFVSGRLSDDLADGVMRHLESCHSCESAVEEIEEESADQDPLIHGLRDVPAHPDPSNRDSEGIIRALKSGLSTQYLAGRTAEFSEETGPVPDRLRDYELLERLGAGGMGTVYRARHTRLQKIVALKLIRPERLRNEAARQRFAREMQAAGQLEHPNVVRALDAGEDAGQHFLAMEFLDGTTVSDLVQKQGTVPVEQSFRIIRQAAEGLCHIHDAGLVHRDIKPSNLMCTRSEEGDVGKETIKILDLGLALLASESSEDGLTSQNQVMGTYDYIAPEQARRSHDVDIRADIYSLGCTFYFLLTGKPPFLASTAAEKLVAHQLESPQPLREANPDLPSEVETLVNRMMARNPADRFPHPTALVDAVSALEESLFQPQPAPVTTNSSSKWTSLGWFAASIVVSAAIALIIQQISIKTPHGEVIVEWAEGIAPDDFQIEIKGEDNVQIVDSSNEWKISIEEGAYTANVKGGHDELQLRPREIRVLRSETERIRVTLKPIPPAAIIKPVVAPERAAAEWVIASGGSISTFAEPDTLIRTLSDLTEDPLELQAIDLTGLKPESIDLPRLATLPNLVQLSIGTQPAANEQQGIRPGIPLNDLTSFGTLRILNCRGMNFTDARIAELSKLKQQQLLSVAGCSGVLPERLARLRELLPECEVVSDVDDTLESQRLKDLSAKFGTVEQNRRVARWVLSLGGDIRLTTNANADISDISQLPSQDLKLLSIDLRDCRCTAKELRRLNGLQSLRTLHLGTNWGPTEMDTTTISVLKDCELPELNHLLCYSIQLTNEDLKGIETLDGLVELRLKGAPIDDEGLAVIAGIQSIKHLLLEGTRVTGSGFQHFADHELETLFLIEAPLSDAAFMKMPAWKTLRKLRVDGTPLSDKAIQSIARYPAIEDLGFNLLVNTSPEAWSLFEYVPRLQQVRFRANAQSVDDTLIPRLANCPELRSLDIELSSVTDAGLLKLKGSAIRYLDLRGCRLITRAGVLALKKILPDCRILSNVDGVGKPVMHPTAQ